MMNWSESRNSPKKVNELSCIFGIAQPIINIHRCYDTLKKQSNSLIFSPNKAAAATRSDGAGRRRGGYRHGRITLLALMGDALTEAHRAS